jgi:hypothetical protein
MLDNLSGLYFACENRIGTDIGIALRRQGYSLGTPFELPKSHFGVWAVLDAHGIPAGFLTVNWGPIDEQLYQINVAYEA